MASKSPEQRIFDSVVGGHEAVTLDNIFLNELRGDACALEKVLIKAADIDDHGIKPLWLEVHPHKGI